MSLSYSYKNSQLKHNVKQFEGYFEIGRRDRCGSMAQTRVNATVVSSTPIRRNGLLFINIFIFSLWQQGIAWRRKSTRNTSKEENGVS